MYSYQINNKSTLNTITMVTRYSILKHTDFNHIQLWCTINYPYCIILNSINSTCWKNTEILPKRKKNMLEKYIFCNCKMWESWNTTQKLAESGNKCNEFHLKIVLSLKETAIILHYSSKILYFWLRIDVVLNPEPSALFFIII